MPVSLVPCVLPLLLIATPFLFLLRGVKQFLFAAAASVIVVATILLSVFVPGWLLMPRAKGGDPVAQYELARWTENRSERIGALVLWPYGSDVLGGYEWLERAASQDYPPAVWLVGVRLKYGIHVPRPGDWTGPGGNVFPQPARGQAMIDRAVNELGFQPPPDEERYYWTVYRR